MGLSRVTLVVDGNNLLIRSIKAMERVALTSDDGVWTAPAFTFINMMSAYVRREKPYRLVVCWDGGRSTYRASVFAGYKAARSERVEEDAEESPFAIAKMFLTLANIHHVELPGVEADDLVGAYWRQRMVDERIIILSGDKDFFQLLDGWTELVRPGGKQGDDRWTANRVRTEMQCRPEHIPLVMALTGDSGDNVPGLPGFGRKTACKYLARFDWDLDRLLDSNDKRLPLGAREIVERNLKLVTLRDPIAGLPSVAIPPRFEPTDRTNVGFHDLVEFLRRYRFVSVEQRLLEGTLWKEESDERFQRQAL